MRHCPLDEALFPDGETPVKVTKIELEALPGGEVEWSLWSGEEKFFVAVAKPALHASMIRTTAWMVAAMTRVPK